MAQIIIYDDEDNNIYSLNMDMDIDLLKVIIADIGYTVDESNKSKKIGGKKIKITAKYHDNLHKESE